MSATATAECEAFRCTAPCEFDAHGRTLAVEEARRARKWRLAPLAHSLAAQEEEEHVSARQADGPDGDEDERVACDLLVSGGVAVLAVPADDTQVLVQKGALGGCIGVELVRVAAVLQAADPDLHHGETSPGGAAACFNDN